MSERAMQELYNKNAGTIIDRYSELIDQTREILFPVRKLSGVTAPDLEGLTPSQRRLAEILSPFILIDSTFFSSGWRPLSYFTWFLLFTVWMNLFVGFSEIQDPSNAAPPGTPSNELSLWVRILGLVLLILPPLLLYGYTIWFLTTRRNSWKTRTGWMIALLVFLFYIYSQVRQIDPAEIQALVNDPLFELALFLLIIPAVLWITYNILYYGKFFIELIMSGGSIFVRAYQPVSFQVLRQVVCSPVRSEKAVWLLSELDEQSLNTLKELAKTNLEATEKKTIPTVVLIGVFGFLATLPAFQRFFAEGIQEVANGILGMFSRDSANLTFGGMVFNVVVLVLLTFILAAYIALFQNLFVQGIIVQACTIAEHAQKQAAKTMSRDKSETLTPYLYLRQLLAIIHSVFVRKRP